MAGGLLLGLIEIGIAYVAQGPSQPALTTAAANQQFGTEFMMGFNQAFADESKRRKKSSSLTEAVIGRGARTARRLGGRKLTPLICIPM
jgi:hypothetical protein